MNFVQNRKIWYSISAALMVLSFGAYGVWGLKPGVEFTGGTLAEYELPAQVETSVLVEAATEAGIANANVVRTDKGAMFRMGEVSAEAHGKLAASIVKRAPGAVELRFDSVGPSISQELRSKAVTAVVLTLLLICAYIAWAFRKVSGRIQAWKYGLLVVATGLHDAILPIGVFSVLGHFFGTEVTGAFVAAILTILGYSINDTIVVFDRVRENLTKTEGTVAEIVEASIQQTLSRSLKTSITTVLALLAIYFFGGASTKDFALALTIGIISGTYSSIFLGAPLLVDWQKK